MKLIRNFLFFFVLPAILCAVTAFFLQDVGKQKLEIWSNTPRVIAEPVEYEFKAGTSLSMLSRDLYAKGVVSNHILFRLWVRFFKDYSRFQAGPYRFEGSMSPVDVVQRIVDGDTHVPIVFQVTVPEGFTAEQVFARLIAGGIGSAKEFSALFTDKEFLKKHKIPSPSLEGYLYPATYSFTHLPTAEEALEEMIDTFWRRLPESYEQDIQARDLSLHDAVTIASLIELETRFDEERDMISEVIWARLNKGYPLGIDAAIIYGIEDYDGNIRSKHLKDKSNPYNTRLHKGLPPTPIGSPSSASLQAVKTPTDHGYFYYVVDLDLEGRHHFSKSLKEHNRYVRKFVRDERARR